MMSVFLTIMFLSLNMGRSGGATRPVVTFTPIWRNILVGDSVNLTCNVPFTEPEEPQTYHWCKDNQQIPGNQQTLHIRFTTVNDSGKYQCLISGGDISDPVFLNVTEGHLILQRPPSVIFEGDPLTLRCHHIKGYNEINTTFYRDDEEIKSSNTDSELHIPKADFNLSGLYKCTKHFQHENSPVLHVFSDVFSMSVKELFSPPKIKNLLRIIEGDNMTVRCDTKLDPLRAGTELLFAFYRDGRTVQDFNVSDTYRHSFQLEDFGNYTCEVRTATDTVRKRGDGLYIQINELFSLPKINMTQRITEQDDMTVTCDTRLNSLRPGTQLQFAFYRDGRSVQEFSVSDTYRVRSAQLEDSGNYTCEAATGTVRKMSDGFYIQIHELFAPPKIKVTPNGVIEGGDMNVTCDTKLDPLRAGKVLQFAFYRDGQTVQEFNVSDTYRVRSAKQKDSGNYTCEVRTANYTVRKRSDGLYIWIYDKKLPVAVITAVVIGTIGVIIIISAVLIWKCKKRKSFSRKEPHQATSTAVSNKGPDPQDVCYTYLDMSRFPKGNKIRSDELTVTYATVTNT